jgi:hypothetical protein
VGALELVEGTAALKSRVSFSQFLRPERSPLEVLIRHNEILSSKRGKTLENRDRHTIGHLRASDESETGLTPDPREALWHIQRS